MRSAQINSFADVVLAGAPGICLRQTALSVTIPNEELQITRLFEDYLEAYKLSARQDLML
jgi:hypothetical protein